MLVKNHVPQLCLAENLTVIAKACWKTIWPLKTELFQIVISLPEALIEGRKSKESKPWGLNFSNELQIKALPLCFLEAEDVTSSFRQSIFDWVPLLFWIDSPHIPAKHLPKSVGLTIHSYYIESLTDLCLKNKMVGRGSRLEKASCHIDNRNNTDTVTVVPDPTH
jgi:hypothetical protein